MLDKGGEEGLGQLNQGEDDDDDEDDHLAISGAKSSSNAKVQHQ
jgi:hypothetical protein